MPRRRIPSADYTTIDMFNTKGRAERKGRTRSLQRCYKLGKL